MSEEKRFGIVIVAYHPDLSALSEKVSKYNSVCSDIVIVNNDEANLSVTGAKVINLGHNRGIAYAQNVGVQYLYDQGIDFVFLFDQDSVVEKEYFAQMLREWDRLEAIDPQIGALSPTIYDRNLDKRLPINQLASNSIQRVNVNSESGKEFKNTLPISSGLLTTTKVFKAIGGNVSWLFIDWVDYKFDLDLISAGYSIYTTNQVTINHSIGNGQPHRFFGKTLHVFNHSPFREYYFFRNAIFFYRCDGKQYPQLKPYIRHVLATRLLFVLYEQQRWQRAKRIFKGILEGAKVNINEVKTQGRQ